VRKIFHWKYSQAVLPQLVRAWLAAALAGKFLWALPASGGAPSVDYRMVATVSLLVEQRMQSEEFAIYADPKI
jgi:hypothetical protein